MTDEVPNIVGFVTQCYERIRSERDLSPSNEIVNSTLSELVSFVTKPRDDISSQVALAILSDSGILHNLQAICQNAEYLLENYFSTAVARE